jgi:ABC-type transport system involved in multi-copper enzyme maturation permease subunit
MTDPTDPTEPTEPTAPVQATIEEVAVASIPSAEFPARTDRPTGRRRGGPAGGLRRTASGISAVGVKELRGRMRGRRAFVIVSLYLILLAGFTWMVELTMERTITTGLGGNAAFATAAVGQGIFAALLMLETLLVAFLAPMATAGSISLEREKQTLEMLAATPITSVAIVVGKLISALVYVWLLIAASIPLTAIVFVFGGVAPEDVVRGYLVLVVTALGFGSFGLFCSSLVKRTQAATAITIFGVLALSIGSLFIIVFWQALAVTPDGRGTGPIKGAPPAPIVFLNPFLAQVDIAPTDVLCLSDNSLRYYCRFRSQFILDQNGVIVVDTTGGGQIIKPGGGIAVPAPAIRQVPVNLGPVTGISGDDGTTIFDAGPQPIGPVLDQPPLDDTTGFGVPTDKIWPRTVVAWLLLSVVFLLLSVQFVSPTRRWRLRRDPRAVGNEPS